MTYYGHVVDVSAPAAYDATNAELLRRTGGHVDGLTRLRAHPYDRPALTSAGVTRNRVCLTPRVGR